METRNDAEGRQKIWNMIKDIQVCLMATRGQDGLLHARPMVAQHTEFESELWFFTRADCRKVEEIAGDSTLLLSYSQPSEQNYVSISGKGEIISDKAEIKKRWKEPMRTWFPKGPEDSDIALIKVTVELAEYWDAPSSTLVYAYGYVKARLTGEAPNPGDVGQVKFPVKRA